jgi:hypothetical protein
MAAALHMQPGNITWQLPTAQRFAALAAEPAGAAGRPGDAACRQLQLQQQLDDRASEVAALQQQLAVSTAEITALQQQLAEKDATACNLQLQHQQPDTQRQEQQQQQQPMGASGSGRGSSSDRDLKRSAGSGAAASDREAKRQKQHTGGVAFMDATAADIPAASTRPQQPAETNSGVSAQQSNNRDGTAADADGGGSCGAAVAAAAAAAAAVPAPADGGSMTVDGLKWVAPWWVEVLELVGWECYLALVRLLSAKIKLEESSAELLLQPDHVPGLRRMLEYRYGQDSAKRMLKGMHDAGLALAALALGVCSQPPARVCRQTGCVLGCCCRSSCGRCRPCAHQRCTSKRRQHNGGRFTLPERPALLLGRAYVRRARAGLGLRQVGACDGAGGGVDSSVVIFR